MADDQLIDQSEIEQLLNQAEAAVPPQAENPPASDAKDAVPEPAGQAGIEKLVDQDGDPPAAPPPKPETPTAATPGAPADEGNMRQGDVEYLLSQAERALQSIGNTAAGGLPEGATSFQFDEFPGAAATTESATIDLVRDVELGLRIELGRTSMYLEDVLKLRKGSVVPLDKLAGDPVDIHVNGRLIARGEVLVLNDNFCVRVAELISGTNLFG